MVPTVYASHVGANGIYLPWWCQPSCSLISRREEHGSYRGNKGTWLSTSLTGLQNRTAVARLSWLEDVDYRLTNSRHTIKQEAFKCSMRLFFLTHLMCTIQASITTTTKIPTWRWKKNRGAGQVIECHVDPSSDVMVCSLAVTRRAFRWNLLWEDPVSSGNVFPAPSRQPLQVCSGERVAAPSWQSPTLQSSHTRMRAFDKLFLSRHPQHVVCLELLFINDGPPGKVSGTETPAVTKYFPQNSISTKKLPELQQWPAHRALVYYPLSIAFVQPSANRVEQTPLKYFEYFYSPH